MVKESQVPGMSVCGGSLALDFLNTVSGWTPGQGSDYLETYHDFYLWTQKLNVLRNDELAGFKGHVKRKQFNERSTLSGIRAARASLFDVFEGIASGKRVTEKALDASHYWLKKMHSHKRLTATKSGEVALTFSGDHMELLPLWYVLHDAEILMLDHSRWSRIRMCPSCGWFFLDSSKGGRRKWCDMLACGSRDKALRYYHSVKR